MRLVGIVVAIVIGVSSAHADNKAPPTGEMKAPPTAEQTAPPTAEQKAPPTPAPAKKAPPTTEQQLKPYSGRLVYSPDAPPTSADELPHYLKANATADNRYDIIKGPPWPMHLVAVLAKDPGAKPVQLVIADKADKKLAPMHTAEVRPQKRIVFATSEATIAAGFASNKTYVVRLMQGKTVLAKAEITLKD
jgi:hypothetical protein